MRRMDFLVAVSAVLLLLAYSVSCNKDRTGEDGAKGCLMLKFDGNPRELSKVSEEMPDTNDFLLTISPEGGVPVFDGFYSDIPEKLELDPGSYRVYVRSSDFERPAFSMPQYGDEQCVMVPSGDNVQVCLECHQINAGVRLAVSPGFLEEYPGGVLFLKSAGDRLMYGYSEKRIAYFRPGSISLVLDNEGKQESLLTRTVGAQEVLTLKVSVASAGTSSKGISISLDTARIWNWESYVIGEGDSKGTGYENAFTVNQAKESVGREDVWVSGFIVGGDLTSASVSFDSPFKSSSNLAIAARSSVSSRESCIAVQLPSGDVREALNLVSNPEMLGRQVCLNGDIVESYFGIVGLKNVSDFVLK